MFGRYHLHAVRINGHRMNAILSQHENNKPAGFSRDVIQLVGRAGVTAPLASCHLCLMSDTELSIRLACRAVLDDYAVAVDAGDAAAIVSLFTPDGVLRRGDLELVGEAGIPRILEGRPADLVMRHLLATASITPHSNGREASGHSYYLLYNSRGGDLPIPFDPPFSLGDWLSRFVLTEHGWKLASHEVRRVFVRKPPVAAAS